MACYQIPYPQVHAFWRTFYHCGKNLSVNRMVCHKLKLNTIGYPRRTYSSSILFEKDSCKGCCGLSSGFFKVLRLKSLRGISTCAQNATLNQSTPFESAICEDGTAAISPSNGRVMLNDGISIIYRAYYKLLGVFVPCKDVKGKCVSLKMGYTGSRRMKRSASKVIQAVVSGVNGVEVSPSSSSIEEFIITASSPDKDNKLKSTVEVSGTKTQEIYDEVFSKMVDEAQPVPGFRRVKGGKTPNIPKDILLEILGPSKVYEQVIRKVINSSIAEYVAKEGLSVGKDLQIEQSLEDLEARFEPGGEFRFDVVVQFQDLK